jgi:hypothetical protein
VVLGKTDFVCEKEEREPCFGPLGEKLFLRQNLWKRRNERSNKCSNQNSEVASNDIQ